MSLVDELVELALDEWFDSLSCRLAIADALERHGIRTDGEHASQ